MAALVNPVGEDPAKETVSLMNASSETVNLRQWAIADRLKRKHSLNDISLAPGAVATVPLTGEDAQFGNDGGIITLLDPQGVKIDGVSYTKADEPIPLTSETRCRSRQGGGKRQNILSGVPSEQRVFYTYVETTRKSALVGSEVQFP